MPDTIQFTNGNQIVHSYDALGKRLLTTYYTRRHDLVEPATSTLPGTVTNDPQQYSMVSYADVGNKRYKKYGTTEWQLDYVFNPEGYIRFYGGGDCFPFYYIKDHLGNVREVYVNPEPGYKECAQRTQYYPSGLPWNETYFPSEQPFKYNGKEFIEMHGLDEYDSEARWYYPAIMRTTTMDPLCEKYYSTSPYAWCGNNPVMLVDPDGRDIDEENEHTITQLEKRIDRKIAWTRFCQRLAISSERQDHLTEKMNQLQTSKDDFSKMREDHSTIYTFVAIKGGEGFTTNETSVGEHKKIAVNYCSKENLIHESRHAGDIARANILGLEYKPTLMGEVSAYKAQLAFSGSIKLLTAVVLPNLPMLTQAFEINSFKSITKDWVRQIVIFHKKEKKYEFPYKDLQ